LAIIEMVMIQPMDSFGGLFTRDAFADFFIYLILFVAFLVLLSVSTYGGDQGTYTFLLLISFAGAIWVVMATDLIALFLAWELMSTPTYVLAALGPHRGAVDGATKYFIMGMMATVFMLFGIALVYGVTGETTLSTLATVVNSIWVGGAVMDSAAWTLILAMVLFVIAFGFKVGIFPGWMWVADTYGTADGSVVAYLAGGAKKTGVSAVMRIMIVGFFIARFEWMPLLITVSIATMVIGNVLALQFNEGKFPINRMLAYSSIAMMGYLFVGLAAATELGAAAAMFHAFAHALMKAGAFILIWAMAITLGKEIDYNDLKGLGKRAPILSAFLAILIFALAGFPLTVGLWSKWILLPQAAVEVGLWWLALILLLNSVFSLGYYLRVLRFCYFMEPEDDTPIVIPKLPMIAVAITVIAVIVLFAFPGLVLDYALEAASVLFTP
jgi:NADH-quinone oxidoreductase subunit N